MNFLQQPPGKRQFFQCIETIGQSPPEPTFISFAVFRPRQLQGRRRLRLHHFLCKVFFLFLRKAIIADSKSRKHGPGIADKGRQLRRIGNSHILQVYRLESLIGIGAGNGFSVSRPLRVRRRHTAR